MYREGISYSDSEICYKIKKGCHYKAYMRNVTVFFTLSAEKF